MPRRHPLSVALRTVNEAADWVSKVAFVSDVPREHGGCANLRILPQGSMTCSVDPPDASGSIPGRTGAFGRASNSNGGGHRLIIGRCGDS
ncbi:hypothetical protein ACIBJF_51500 [Streptomyces sp. NPDC050743]|uniref:hypothetical protein n=1 Tax=Streptomyces sp. NPDC050743 TaxID=3365634 RepID=UPI0037BD5260